MFTSPSYSFPSGFNALPSNARPKSLIALARYPGSDDGPFSAPGGVLSGSVAFRNWSVLHAETNTAPAAIASQIRRPKSLSRLICIMASRSGYGRWLPVNVHPHRVRANGGLSEEFVGAEVEATILVDFRIEALVLRPRSEIASGE